MKVYRLETQHENGIYTSRYDLNRSGVKLIGQMHKKHRWGSGRPNPFDDGIRGFTYNHYSATPSLEALREWFDLGNFFEKLLRNRTVYLAEYEVPSEFVKFGKGGLQVAFLKDEATNKRFLNKREVLAGVIKDS